MMQEKRFMFAEMLFYNLKPLKLTQSRYIEHPALSLQPVNRYTAKEVACTIIFFWSLQRIYSSWQTKPAYLLNFPWIRQVRRGLWPVEECEGHS